MKTSAAHEVAKNTEKEKARRKDLELLALAKKQQATKKGKWIFSAEKRAHIFQSY